MFNPPDNKGEASLKTGGMVRDKDGWYMPSASIILRKMIKGIEMEESHTRMIGGNDLNLEG